MNAKEMIQNCNEWVVIGDVCDESKYAHKILGKFKSKGYRVVGVHPKGGEGIFKELEAVPFKADAVDLCINPISGFKYIKELPLLGIKNVLVQPGAESDEIIKFCKENEINVIEDCALVQLSKI